jgi:multidrug resistance efflux pump
VLAQLDDPLARAALARAEATLTTLALDRQKQLKGATAEELAALKTAVATSTQLEALSAQRLTRQRSLAEAGARSALMVDGARLSVADAERRRDEAQGQLALKSAGLLDEEKQRLDEAQRAAEADVAVKRRAVDELTIHAESDGLVTWLVARPADLTFTGLPVRRSEALLRLQVEPQVSAELDIPLEYEALLSREAPVTLRFEGSDEKVVTTIKVSTASAASEAGQGEQKNAATRAAQNLNGPQVFREASMLRARTERFTAPRSLDGARGMARVSLARRTGLQWAIWQLQYFSGYFWWRLW